MRVDSVGSAAACIERSRHRSYDLLLIDERLEDGSGLSAIDVLRSLNVRTPFILITGFATVPLAVKAARLGAIDVVEKPFDPDHLVSIVEEALRSTADSEPRAAATAAAITPGATLPSVETVLADWPESPTKRWLEFALKASVSAEDPRTLRAWARQVGVSHSVLREACYVVGIAPHVARDFVRALRLALIAETAPDEAWYYLNVPDRRSLIRFAHRIGVDSSLPFPNLRSFIKAQRLLRHQHPIARAVRQLPVISP
jgi:CheY-like chemotaxis protein